MRKIDSAHLKQVHSSNLPQSRSCPGAAESGQHRVGMQCTWDGLNMVIFSLYNFGNLKIYCACAYDLELVQILFCKEHAWEFLLLHSANAESLTRQSI